MDSLNLTKPYEEYSNEDLADLVTLGDHQAFTLLVKRNTTNFYKTAFYLTESKQASEEIVQECFLKFWEFPKKWDSNKNVKFNTWFIRVIINYSYDVLRKKKPLFLEDDFDIRDDAESADEILELRRKNQILKQAFSSLNKKQKTAIILTIYNEKKNEEASKIMRMKLKAFQSLLQRSKKELQQNFRKLGGLL